MSLKDQPRLKKVYWKDVRERVAKLQPEFARLVDDLDPGKEFPLYVARYQYGDLIVDEGHAYLPREDGSLIAIDDPNLPRQIRKDLGYGDFRIPAGMVLSKAMELFVKPEGRIIPWVYYPAKSLFALWGYLEREHLIHKPSYHPAKIFSITAGARSVFLLPSIGDLAHHSNLERSLNSRFVVAKKLSDHHQLFVQLTHHEDLNCEWSMDILFFSYNWMRKMHEMDEEWLKLKFFLLKLAWSKTSYWRNKQFYDLAFSWAQSNRYLKSNPYLVDTAKHLIVASMGHVPAFSPALDEKACPIVFLQEIFVNMYKIKYCPIIMQPCYFNYNYDESKPIYYSLNFPTAWEFSPRSQKYIVTLNDLKELQYIIQLFSEEICGGNLRVEDTPLKVAILKVGFEFFHVKEDPGRSILSTKDMPTNDSNLSNCSIKGCDKNFAFAGPFLRGCIKIELKG